MTTSSLSQADNLKKKIQRRFNFVLSAHEQSRSCRFSSVHLELKTNTEAVRGLAI